MKTIRGWNIGWSPSLSEKYRILRVVCDPRAAPLKVVTVHFDRSQKGNYETND